MHADLIVSAVLLAGNVTGISNADDLVMDNYLQAIKILDNYSDEVQYNFNNR